MEKLVYGKILSLMLILMMKNNYLNGSGDIFLDVLKYHEENEIGSSIDTNLPSSGDVEENVDDEENALDLGWELTLVNSDNKIPEGYEFELESIDTYREFDSRAIKYLKEMLSEARKCGVTNFWAQSTYRSIETQEKLYNNKVNFYMQQGKSEAEAKRLTEQTINKPACSEHNLGLAVDFNYVNYDFENTQAFKWLIENAEDYGFVLRYKKEKEDITKVKYEPWHWRYVGKENAIKMNELNMCLEEYVEYLKNEKN